VAELVGYPLGEGVFTSGGMVSNLTALLAARERALPGCRMSGLEGRRGAVYCSQEAHQSVVRAVEVIGLGRNAIRKLPLDDRRRLRPTPWSRPSPPTALTA
jgi:aromatic-L-amino-acid/L-tryptophan decarboxylase